MNLEECSEHINKIWKSYLNNMKSGSIGSPNNHVFLNDLNTFEEIKDDKKTVEPKNKQKIMHNFDLNNYFDVGECKFYPKKSLPKKLVDEIFGNLQNYKSVPDWNKLEAQLTTFSNYLLYSNIDINAYKRKLRNKAPDTINVLILGAGPAGLYTANYINTINLLSPKVNLLVIDNRIIKTKKSYRLPYTRNRIYGVRFDLFSSFFAKFPCMQDLTKKGGIQIKYLENLLIVLTYGFKIPIYFTDEVINQESLKKFLKQNKIDVVFDCTGNRLKNNFIKNIPTNFFRQNIVLDKKKYYVEVKGNNAVLVWKDNDADSSYPFYRHFLDAEIYDSRGNFLRRSLEVSVIYKKDLELLYKFHNKCLKIKNGKFNEVNDIFNNLIDPYLLKQIKIMLLQNEDEYIKFFIISPQFYHKLKISSVIKQKTQKTLYIGAGDTIFSAHFITGAGLNRLLLFINHTIWSLQILSMQQPYE